MCMHALAQAHTRVTVSASHLGCICVHKLAPWTHAGSLVGILALGLTWLGGEDLFGSFSLTYRNPEAAIYGATVAVGGRQSLSPGLWDA